MSQPDPGGWQLTVGIVAAAATLGVKRARAGMPGDGTDLAVSGRFACLLRAVAVPDAVDGDEKGPESRSQPLAQPVAAGPTNVGEYVPKLDEVTAPGAALTALAPETAAADPPEASSHIPGTDRSKRKTIRLRRTCLSTTSPLSTTWRGPHWRFMQHGEHSRRVRDSQQVETPIMQTRRRSICPLIWATRKDPIRRKSPVLVLQGRMPHHRH